MTKTGKKIHSGNEKLQLNFPKQTSTQTQYSFFMTCSESYTLCLPPLPQHIHLGKPQDLLRCELCMGLTHVFVPCICRYM